jgi:hypothetical protein
MTDTKFERETTGATDRREPGPIALPEAVGPVRVSRDPAGEP